MYGQAHAADVDLDPTARAEADSPEARVADALDGDAGQDAQDGEDGEGEEVAE